MREIVGDISMPQCINLYRLRFSTYTPRFYLRLRNTCASSIVVKYVNPASASSQPSFAAAP
jgi:hypothetical protein